MNIRERLQHSGTQDISTAELLTFLLAGGGQQGQNALSTICTLLNTYSINWLRYACVEELCREGHLSATQAHRLRVLCELSQRFARAERETRQQIRSSDDAAHLVRPEMMYLGQEEMHVLLLTTKNYLVERVPLYKGTVYSSVTRIAEIFRPAITRNCPHIIICHNHPSGDPSPSAEDIEFTLQAVKAADLLDIDLLDHLIIGNPKYISLKEQLKW